MTCFNHYKYKELVKKLQKMGLNCHKGLGILCFPSYCVWWRDFDGTWNTSDFIHVCSFRKSQRVLGILRVASFCFFSRDLEATWHTSFSLILALVGWLGGNLVYFVFRLFGILPFARFGSSAKTLKVFRIVLKGTYRAYPRTFQKALELSKKTKL